MAYRKLNNSIKMKDLRCICGDVYKPLPDEEAESQPTSMLAKLFGCYSCDTQGWFEPMDFNIDDWSDIEDLSLAEECLWFTYD